MRQGRGLAAALIALTITVTACGDRVAHSPTPAPVSAGGTCKLGPTNGLRAIEMGSRTYHLYVPAGIDGQVPLLVSLHGTGANGTIQAAITHWTDLADSNHFIAVFPDGLNTLWLWGVEKSYDVDFIFQVIADVRSSGCLDESRVFIDGWSEGSYMAQRMACANGDPNVSSLGVTIAGVHGYAGGNPGDATCPASRPTRVLLSQGLDDRLIDPQKIGYPAFAAWSRRYRCAAVGGTFSSPQRLSGCVAGADVAWWPIVGQGHLDWSCTADPLWHDRGVWDFFTSNRAPADTTCA